MMKSKIYVAIIGAVIAGLSATSASAQENRNDPAACVAGRPSVVARVHGFKGHVGIVRAQVYGDSATDFLAKGKWLRRIEMPRNTDDVMTFCLPVPKAGRYAIAIRHDANNDSKSDWNDGGGFSRNPKLSLFDLKPSYSAVFVTVENRPLEIDIVMQYRRGLSIGPLR